MTWACSATAPSGRTRPCPNSCRHESCEGSSWRSGGFYARETSPTLIASTVPTRTGRRECSPGTLTLSGTGTGTGKKVFELLTDSWGGPVDFASAKTKVG